jgi:NitT/TauT family transport system substrate-binding protein
MTHDPAPSVFGRRDLTRRASLTGLVGAAAVGYGTLAARAVSRGAVKGPNPSGRMLTPLSRQLGWLKGVQFAGEFLAQEKGYMAREGIAPTFTAGGPGTDYRTLVASGRMLVSESSPVSMIEAAVQGQPLVAFAAVMQRDPGAIMSPPEKPITSLKDMVGRTIGIPASIRRLLGVLLQRAQIDIKSINFVPVGTDAGMLAARQIDGYYSYATTAVPGLKALGMDPHVLYLSDLGVPGYAQTLIVREDTLAKHHDLLVRYTRALVGGWRFLVEQPEQSARLIVDKWALPGTSYDDQLMQAKMMRGFIATGDALTKGLLWIDPGVFEKALVFARASGVAPPGKAINLDRLVTQSVIKEALGVS